jgi:ABC-type uncharacterized transport system fused permease/ATPase subunit
LPLSDQQMLVIARVLLANPLFAFLDRPRTALGDKLLETVLRNLTDRSITYVLLDDTESRREYYDGVLYLEDQGLWRWSGSKF